MDMNVLDWIAFVLVVVGSVNVGLGALGFNVIEMIIGSISVLHTIVNVLIGLSGLYLIYMIRK
jgi:uncharacterized membrane protein YuzA (DUF378 family)